ncbi:LysR family transcriptional regulator [Thauera sp.]|uniref:LysR family transcriptional regulator n=1 Tax=Thauera sp. TaxID=1905334 RepID=UPI002582FF61|nr:LysR family transcriptional regulator [Thauera sp.]
MANANIDLNFKHLRYFWMVARVGSIAGAARMLNLAPHSISAQLATFEATLGVTLFRRAGRRLELTEAGERILGHAEEIFALGEQVVEIVRDDGLRRDLPFRIGIPDSMPKSVAHRLIEPALRVDRPGRLVCREAPLSELLGELALRRLDLIIADRAMPAEVGVRGHSTLLAESGLTVFAAPKLVPTLQGTFPAMLDGAPFLLPGQDVAHRAAMLRWFEERQLQPDVIAEFDDSALLKAFGQGGAGLFAAPTMIEPYVRAQYGVMRLGEMAAVRTRVYAITTERRLSHLAMKAILDNASPDDDAAGGAGQP